MSRVRIIDALFIARRHTDAYGILLPIDTGWLMGVPFGANVCYAGIGITT